MKLLNLQELNNFLKSNFGDNLTLASKETGVSKSTFCLLKKGDRDIGKDTLIKLIKFCKAKKIDFTKLLFF